MQLHDNKYDYNLQLIEENNKDPFVWDNKKSRTEPLAKSFERLGKNKKAALVRECGTFLEFRRYIESREFKLHAANFCKVRLCPLCSWRRSLKIFGQTSAIMEKIPKSYRFIFLTLTCKNPTGEELANTLDKLFKAYNLFAKRKDFKDCFVGWFRALEITYNKSSDTYHPHFHVILCCHKNYFKQLYLKQEKFQQMWKECMGVDYDPVVDVRKFSNKKGVAEASKYAVKDKDYVTKKGVGIDRVIDLLDNVLKNRRLVAYGGNMKEIKKQLKLDDAIDGDLINTKGEELREDLGYIVERYAWHVGYKGYYQIKESNYGEDLKEYNERVEKVELCRREIKESFKVAKEFDLINEGC